MFDINGQNFLDTVSELAGVQVLIQHAGTEEDRKAALDQKGRDNLMPRVDALISALTAMQVRSPLHPARRLRYNIEHDPNLTWTQVKDANADIQSRLRDELGDIKMFAVNQQESALLRPGAELLAPPVAQNFPALVFEIEEAAKCLALGRSTASAFHAMRALEVPIRSLAAFLGIPDPTKPADRNWGTVLEAIKTKIDEKYPKNRRMPGSLGAKLEAVYVTLDAIKNPWRNATMHTENTYQPHEALHILQCVNVFLTKIAEICDQDGNPI